MLILTSQQKGLKGDDCSDTTDKERDLSSGPEKLGTLSHTHSTRQWSRRSNSRWRED